MADPEAWRPAAPGLRYPGAACGAHGQFRRAAVGAGGRGRAGQGGALVGLPDRAADRLLRHGAVHHLWREKTPDEARAARRRQRPAGLRALFRPVRPQPACAGAGHRGVLHRVQPARGIAAVAGQQGGAGRWQGDGDGGLFHQPVPRRGAGRHSRWLAVPACRPGRGVHRLCSALCDLAGHCCYYARTAVRDQFAPAARCRGTGRCRTGRTPQGDAGSGGRRGGGR